jgi:SCY1-like protein 2
MVEPLEETRSELTFVTENVSSSLGSLLSASRAKGGKHSEVEVDLDEVEIQKGVLQIAKGLAFLHQQAKMVHLNLSPDAILVNAKVCPSGYRADERAIGSSLACLLLHRSRSRMGRPRNTCTQRLSRDSLRRYSGNWITWVGRAWTKLIAAPEYALDSTLTPASDLYSLGCVLFAVHMGGRPPYKNSGSMQSLREHVEGPLLRKDWASGSKWERCSAELKGGSYVLNH